MHSGKGVWHPGACPRPATCLIVLLAVPGRSVHQARAALSGDVVAAHHHGRHAVKQRVPVLAALQVSAPVTGSGEAVQ